MWVRLTLKPTYLLTYITLERQKITIPSQKKVPTCFPLTNTSLWRHCVVHAVLPSHSENSACPADFPPFIHCDRIRSDSVHKTND